MLGWAGLTPPFDHHMFLATSAPLPCRQKSFYLFSFVGFMVPPFFADAFKNEIPKVLPTAGDAPEHRQRVGADRSAAAGWRCTGALCTPTARP